MAEMQDLNLEVDSFHAAQRHQKIKHAEFYRISKRSGFSKLKRFLDADICESLVWKSLECISKIISILPISLPYTIHVFQL